MKCGDVCLAHFPFTDGSAAKLRPILIISAEEFNLGEDVVALPISSQPDPRDSHALFIDHPKHLQAGLRVPSSVKWTKPCTISRVVVRRHLGELPADILDDACCKVRSMFHR